LKITANFKKHLRKQAADLVEQWANELTRTMEEPRRKGRAKGEKIGFSKDKQRAAYLMVAWPRAISLGQVAKKAKTTLGTVKVWRTQSDFLEAIAAAERRFTDGIIGSINAIIMRMASDFGDSAPVVDGPAQAAFKLANFSVQPFDTAEFLSNVYPFLSDLTRNHVERWIRKQIYRDPPDDYSLAVWGVHQLFQDKLNVFSDHPPRRENLDMSKAVIDRGIELLADSDWCAARGPSKVEELAESLKSYISGLLDLLDAGRT
jgi:hypothetical protein